MKLDATDEAIINVLLDNSKLSVRDISSRIGVSSVTVLNRVKKLETNNIIKNYTINLNYEKADILFSLLIEVKTKEIIEIKKELISLIEPIFIYEITGEYNIVALVHLKEKQKLQELISLLQTNKKIESVKTKFILNTLYEGKIRL